MLSCAFPYILLVQLTIGQSNVFAPTFLFAFAVFIFRFLGTPLVSLRQEMSSLLLPPLPPFGFLSAFRKQFPGCSVLISPFVLSTSSLICLSYLTHNDHKRAANFFFIFSYHCLVEILPPSFSNALSLSSRASPLLYQRKILPEVCTSPPLPFLFRVLFLSVYRELPPRPAARSFEG